MRIDSQRPVRCLIQATDIARMQSLVETSIAGRSALRSASRIDYLENHHQITEKLAQACYSLVVVALDNPQQPLPDCLLNKSGLSILVLAPPHPDNCADEWMRQGATDIVSQERYDQFGHVFRRLLDECSLRAEVESLNNQLAAQNRLQNILLNTPAEALLLWQNGKALHTNSCLGELIQCTESDNLARTSQWKRWISAETAQILAHTSNLDLKKVIVTNYAGTRYQAWIEQLILNEGPARLIRINPKPVTDSPANQLETDSVTGLLARSAFVSRWQLWLDSLHSDQRYTAMLLTLPDMQSESGCGGIDGTMQDLLAYRASNAIEQHFGHSAMVGRACRHGLLLVQIAERSASRKSALTVKALLGSLGGLIDDPASITIKTLTLAPTSLTAGEVLSRLERADKLANDSMAFQDNRRTPQLQTPPCSLV